MTHKLQVKRALQRDVLILGSALISGCVAFLWCYAGKAYFQYAYNGTLNIGLDSVHFVESALAGVMYFLLGCLFSYFTMAKWPYNDAHFAGIRPGLKRRVFLKSQLCLLLSLLAITVLMLSLIHI